MDHPVVETTLGRLRGRRQDGVAVFKGVRYGQSTAGARRFLPPQAPLPAAGISDALSWAASAPQGAMPHYAVPFYAWYAAIEPMSEDCLFLNVFSPGPGSGRRPVMVWLHGGGWGHFASSAPGTDATRLARSQDVVVVSVNHRLNAFGFLSLADDPDARFADAGNAGLLDLVLGLQWVRDNAAAFGGDPGNVTIFGQSGGAAKVAALMAMPAAAGLFHRAIVQSTSGGIRLAAAGEAARMSAELAAALGLPAARGAALQSLSMEDLIRAQDPAPGPFRPVVDLRSFKAHPFDPVAPAGAADVPLLVGNADTESTWYYAAHPACWNVSMADVKRRLMRFFRLDAAGVDRILDAYRGADPQGDACDLMTAVTTDYLYKRNTLRLAALQAAGARAPVYAYTFARATPVGNGRFKAPHSAELPFIFGTTDAAVAHCGSGTDIAPMTELMMGTWAAFARHGVPQHERLPAWRPYDAAARSTMVLALDSHIEQDPGGTARATLASLPLYEYSNDRGSFLKD